MSCEQDCVEARESSFRHAAPHWMTDDDMAMRLFDEAVASVIAQTDPNWLNIWFVKGEELI